MENKLVGKSDESQVASRAFGTAHLHIQELISSCHDLRPQGSGTSCYATIASTAAGMLMRLSHAAAELVQYSTSCCMAIQCQARVRVQVSGSVCTVRHHSRLQIAHAACSCLYCADI